MDSDDDGPRAVGGIDSDDVNLPKATINKLWWLGTPLYDMLSRVYATCKPSDGHSQLPYAVQATQKFLPADFSCSKETKDLMAECCKEFILTISSEANEICDKEAKKTLAPEHIIAALNSLGFEAFVEEVQSVFSEHKELAKDERQQKKKKQSGSGMTQEELLKAQEELFAASRAKMEAGTAGVEPKAEA
ncbi:negative cofactor 2 transcription regulator complex subunit ncb2 [Microbotryomycetes sp. JL201]|nr:negative cofactor 2 transcription regulator complex subunit ncb2 [Microbotryomycetes sp. JL201]